MGNSLLPKFPGGITSCYQGKGDAMSTSLKPELSLVERYIFMIRNQQIMIDRDLAYLYGVETKVLNQAVKRNVARFPAPFRFQLTQPETEQLVTDCDRFASHKDLGRKWFAFSKMAMDAIELLAKVNVVG